MTDRIESFLRHVRERTAGRHDTDRPAYELADSLMAQMRRELVGLSPQEDERVVNEIRRRTGT